MVIARLLRRYGDDADMPVISAHTWLESRDTIGSIRPEGWGPEIRVVRRGIRGGVGPRAHTRTVQIRVDTQ